MSHSPADLLMQLAARITERSVVAPASDESERSQAIAFEVGGKTALVSMKQVSEVMEVPTSTPVPGVQAWLTGVANVRGNMLPLVDLSLFFGFDLGPASSRRAVIAIERPDTRLGLVVDHVIGMRKIDDHKLTVAADSRFAGFVAGLVELEDEQLPLLDIDLLLTNEKFNRASAT